MYKILDNSTNETYNDIARLNPFRYRGYYYDAEAGLYYLNSRYYDPELGRFINADGIDNIDTDNINGFNLYMYCADNPVIYYDPYGTFLLSLISGIVISACIGYIAYRGIEAATNTKIANGSSSITGGISTIITSIALFGFGPVGWVLGTIGIVSGFGMSLFGTAELQEGITGNNWIKDAGMSASAYNGLYNTFAISSFLVSVGGMVYMNYANVKLTNYPKSGRSFQRFSLYDEMGLKQYRYLDYKGQYWFDKDFRHTGNLKFPHYHGWENMTRTKGHWSLGQLIRWLFRR